MVFEQKKADALWKGGGQRAAEDVDLGGRFFHFNCGTGSAHLGLLLKFRAEPTEDANRRDWSLRNFRQCLVTALGDVAITGWEKPLLFCAVRLRPTIWRMNFHGKNAVVTGGANGIGFAIARNIAAAGGSVWIFDLASENPAEAAARIGAQACVADVTDRSSLERAFDEAGVPDVVVVNAGIGPGASLRYHGELWGQTLAVNLTGAFRHGADRGGTNEARPKGIDCLNGFDELL